ncbi:hypothetical protein L210DRAFT_3429617 [Boletus edulis BED1]|uniref:DUF4219 domain-containing protein n=1 Tax=Boletus edulis BED1 TaxID=1328754 RepID=A0AAD4BBR2_BOLED|nr:hypothetical protein L210DRAFT_3429617 [Boletus edulis BED1]
MPRLDEVNYLTWHVRMRALLIRSNLWGIVSGKETAPDPKMATSSVVDAFTLRQLKAAAEIALYVDDSQIFSHMEKRPKQPITSWIGDVKAQAHLMKDIGIDLPDLFTIVVLTSGLPLEYDSVVVALDAVKPNELTLDLAISRLLNEEERHLSRKQLDDYKALIKGELDTSDMSETIFLLVELRRRSGGIEVDGTKSRGSRPTPRIMERSPFGDDR